MLDIKNELQGQIRKYFMQNNGPSNCENPTYLLVITSQIPRKKRFLNELAINANIIHTPIQSFIIDKISL